MGFFPLSSLAFETSGRRWERDCCRIPFPSFTAGDNNRKEEEGENPFVLLQRRGMPSAHHPQ